MGRNSAEHLSELSETLIEKRDSQQITDLIEQLERDLKDTRKHTVQER